MAEDIVMSLLFVAFTAATFAVVSNGVRTLWPGRGRAEHLLLVLLLGVVGVEVEVQLLAWVPINAPLRALPWSHAGLLLSAFAWTRRGTAHRGKAGPWWAVGQRFTALERVVVALVCAAILASLIWGTITAPGGVDELAYHVPQAALINQHQDVGRPLSQLPWTYTYPRGGPILWATTMQFLGDDKGFRAVQAALGVQLLVALFVLARRSRADRLPALLGVLTLASAPVFFRMTTLSTADIGYAAAIVTMVALLAPAASELRPVDLRLAAVAFAQAAVFKPPALALVIGAGIFLLRGGLRPDLLSLLPRTRARLLSDLGVISILLISASTYLVNLREYRNPFYPVDFHVLGHEFHGPLPELTDAGTGGHTSWGEVAEMSRGRLWLASFLDWDEPLNEDSFGSIGPAVTALIVVGLVLMAVLAVRSRDRWLATVIVVCAGCILYVPSLFLPRYALPVVALLIALSTVGLRLIDQMRIAIVPAMVALSVAATLPSAEMARSAVNFYRQVTPPEDRHYYRMDVAERTRLNTPEIAQSSRLVAFVRKRFHDGDRVAYDINTHPTLLWNTDYSNEIYFVPLSAAEAYPNWPFQLVPPTPAELDRFLSQIQRIDPQWVVLYSRSSALEAVAALGYTRVFRDPASDGIFAVTVLRAPGLSGPS
jgi:hypothetical protein